MRMHVLDREAERSQSGGGAGEGESYLPLIREPTGVNAKTLESSTQQNAGLQNAVFRENMWSMLSSRPLWESLFS